MDHALPFLDGELEHAGADERPRICHQRIDTVEPLDDTPGGVEVGQVDPGRALGGLDAPALRAQPLGDREPDPAARAGD